jgi:hypothetical protein
MSQGEGGGRPRKFTDADKLFYDGMKYINECIENKKPILFTGLAVSLGTYKDVLHDYESGMYDDDSNKFSTSIKRLKVYCERFAEERIFSTQPAGAIFALKNYGWKDKTETDINLGGEGLTIILGNKPDSV